MLKKKLIYIFAFIELINCSSNNEISNFQEKFEEHFINKVFDAIWKDGLNLNDNSIVEKLLKNLDINPKTFLGDAVDEKIKDELKKRTDSAFKKGIFGVPSFFINNNM